MLTRRLEKKIFRRIFHTEKFQQLQDALKAELSRQKEAYEDLRKGISQELSMAVCPNGAIEEPEWNILKEKMALTVRHFGQLSLNLKDFLSAGEEKVSDAQKKRRKNFHANSVHLLFMKKKLQRYKRKLVRVSRKKKND